VLIPWTIYPGNFYRSFIFFHCDFFSYNDWKLVLWSRTQNNKISVLWFLINMVRRFGCQFSCSVNNNINTKLLFLLNQLCEAERLCYGFKPQSYRPACKHSCGITADFKNICLHVDLIHRISAVSPKEVPPCNLQT
jgi:hypothetical protein